MARQLAPAQAAAHAILEDFRAEAERTARLATGLEALDALEAALPLNCEHVVPQSWFAKAEPMRGNLHHLFACEPRCNSFRGNTPYFHFADFPALEVIQDQCGRRDQDRFEPQAGKGPVARATLYFLLRYPGRVDPDELPPTGWTCCSAGTSSSPWATTSGTASPRYSPASTTATPWSTTPSGRTRPTSPQPSRATTPDRNTAGR
ncbi:MAG TPA: endonuclease, partial [Gemmatimonadales bacterium]|nr:endonuclease [Gemmatimonadales bacterium]